MHHMRARHQSGRARCTTILIVLMAIISTYYLYSYLTYEYFIENKLAFKRCTSQLANVKYQLDNISEYKKKMEQLLNDLQEECKIEKETVIEYTNNYILMKHHLQVCEMQTEELELKCTELNQKLHNTKKELETCRKPLS